jgi:hypothetical protein
MQKNGLILGPIPKISPKSNFLKKPVTGPRYNQNWPVTGTPIKTRVPVSVSISQNKEPGYPVPVLDFGQKLGNRTGLTPILIRDE